MALRADLAHVTAERDDLKEWKVLHEEFTMDWLARVTAERDALLVAAKGVLEEIAQEPGLPRPRGISTLRASIAACAPPKETR
jgi:hypothetical protein